MGGIGTEMRELDRERDEVSEWWIAQGRRQKLKRSRGSSCQDTW